MAAQKGFESTRCAMNVPKRTSSARRRCQAPALSGVVFTTSGFDVLSVGVAAAVLIVVGGVDQVDPRNP
jgi:hypothetical protein